MHRTQHRLLSALAAATVTLAVGAAPALAGSDGCSGAGCRRAPAPSLPVGPSLPSLSGSPAAPSTTARNVVRVRTVRRTVPRGAVGAGAGGTAPAGPDALAIGLAGSLLLLATGGGLVAAGRRAGS